MSDIVCVGHSIVDIYVGIPDAHIHTDETLKRQEVCLLWGEKYPIHDMQIGMGGNALNVSVGLHLLGVRSSLVSACGKDFFGLYLQASLKRSSVDLTYLQQTNRTDTTVALTLQGERTLLVYHGDEPYLFPEALESDEPTWIFLTSIGTTNFHVMYEAVLTYMERHPKVLLAYNPGSAEIRQVQQVYKVFPKTNILFVNIDEAGALLSQSDIVARTDLTLEDKIRRLIEGLKKLGSKSIIITCGGEGAFGYDGLNLYYQPSFATEVVERTGAGDAFTGGVLAGLLNSHGLSESLRWGAAQSASAIRVVGATTGLMNKNQMLESLKQNTSVQPKKISL